MDFTVSPDSPFDKSNVDLITRAPKTPQFLLGDCEISEDEIKKLKELKEATIIGFEILHLGYSHAISFYSRELWMDNYPIWYIPVQKTSVTTINNSSKKLFYITSL